MSAALSVDPVEPLLHAARAAFEIGDADALRAALAEEPPPALEPDDPRAAELQAWEALADDAPGRAAAHLVDAAQRYQRLGLTLASRRAAALEAALRARAFPPYPDDHAWLAEVAAWLVERARHLEAQLAAAATTDPAQLGAAEAGFRWRLRLRSTPPTTPLRLQRLAARLDLQERDLRWLLAALAAERHPALRRLLGAAPGAGGRLQAGTLAFLLAESHDDAAQLMQRLSPHAPLLACGLLHLNALAERPGASPRYAWLELDALASCWLDSDALPSPGEGLRWMPAAGGALTAAAAERAQLLRDAVAHLKAGGLATLCAPSAATTALWVAHAAQQRPVLCLQAHASPALTRARLSRARGLALLYDAWALVEDARDPHQAEALRALLAELEARPATLLLDAPLDGLDPARSAGLRALELRWPLPSLDEQVEQWGLELARRDLPALPDALVRERIAHAAMSPADVRDVVRFIDHQRLLLPRALTASDAADALAEAVSQRRRVAFHGIASRVRTTVGWGDVVLPDAVLETLMEIITFHRYQEQVFKTWGFQAKVAYGRANSSLFSGEPGTGKTLVAGLIAKELGMELFRVDVSQIVSKWVGETEKNLALIFDEAERSHAVLLFDEADTLFGKRTQVKSAQDRYNNSEVNYLLQRIESFDGIVLLTSNFPDNMDEAFARRLRFKVHFPFPTADERARLWEVMIPEAADTAPCVDFKRLGKHFELAGGHIKNAVLRAAFRAAEAGLPIAMSHLADAAAAECRALGRLVRDHLAIPQP